MCFSGLFPTLITYRRIETGNFSAKQQAVQWEKSEVSLPQGRTGAAVINNTSMRALHALPGVHWELVKVNQLLYTWRTCHTSSICVCVYVCARMCMPKEVKASGTDRILSSLMSMILCYVMVYNIATTCQYLKRTEDIFFT